LTRDRQRFGNAISTRAEGKKAVLRKKRGEPASTLELGRNFLHAASLKFRHPRLGHDLEFSAPLPLELEGVLAELRD